MRKIVQFSGVLGGLLLLVSFFQGCRTLPGQGIPLDAVPVGGTPDLIGFVTAIEPQPNGGAVGVVVVESHADKMVTRYEVSLHSQTIILVQDEETLTLGVFEDLVLKQWVQVWFDGPVRESFPMQGDAAQIVILPAEAVPGAAAEPKPPAEPAEPAPETQPAASPWQPETHPEAFKQVISPDIVVLFAYPDPFLIWDGMIALVHLPTGSEVELDELGAVVMDYYTTDAARAALEDLLADSEQMAALQEQAAEIWGTESGDHSLEALLAQLGEAGVPIALLGGADQVDFQGEMYELDAAGQKIRVYVYQNAAARQAESARIAPDGGSMTAPDGTRVVWDWAVQPHFWVYENLLIQYLGTDPDLQISMSQLFGSPLTALTLGAEGYPETVVIVRDVAKRASLSPEGTVEIVRYDEVTWDDECLGAPLPDEKCGGPAAQPVPGWIVVLRCELGIFEMHADLLGTEIRRAADPVLLPVEQQALDTLVRFFALLAAGEYDAAVPLFGGDYGVLADLNPDLSPEDRAGLLERACQINGLQCLPVLKAELANQENTHTFYFQVVFQTLDGAPFVRGPCCGATEIDMPPQGEFSYTVIQQEQELFQVMELPVYVP